MTVSADRHTLTHTALFCRSAGELVGPLLPRIESALASRERTFVNLAPERLQALKAALGPGTDRVQWSDTERWHPHPARRLRAILDAVGREYPGEEEPVLFVGECPFSVGPPEMVAEWERMDAVLNDALADRSVTMVCVYDTSALPEAVVRRAAQSHPRLGVGSHTRCEQYLDPATFLETVPLALPSPPSSAPRIGGDVAPAEARALVQRVLGGTAGAARFFSDATVEDAAVVVTELVANARRAGAQAIDVWCWWADGDIGVQVDDDGPGLRDPLAGYRRPPCAAIDGRGLWICRQLADLVEVVPNGGGTSVRVRMLGRAPFDGQHRSG